MRTDSMAGLSDRIERLKTRIMKRKGSFPESVNPFARTVALWLASETGGSPVQIRASYLYELTRLAAIEIDEDWTLAGNHLATAHMDMPLPDSANAEHLKKLEELDILPEKIPDIIDSINRWNQQTWRHPAGNAGANLMPGMGYWGNKDSQTVFWSGGWIENHSVRDYEKVIRLGFAGIRLEIEAEMAAADCASPDFPQKENFWMAALRICDAGSLLGKRYADAARRLAVQAQSSEEHTRLMQMANACERVPAQGARTFAEAVQSLWLSHVLTCGEDGINANSLGRLDQMLYPYYAEDIKAGRLTREAAVELMEELACRLYLDYDVQAITLGGVLANGDDAVNDLSHIILESTRNVGFIRDVSIRLHRNTPAQFIHLASELIAHGGGIPFIFNDECFIPALTDHGISIEDARNYAPIGCIELTIPGRANPHAVSGWFNSAKCLELALFDGKDPQSGKQIGPQTGAFDTFATFEDFFSAYSQQVEVLAKRMVYHCNRGELAQREGGPLPCWSVLTDDCIKRGRDITDGGAVYNYHSICFLGTANTADSMMALKKLVFDEHRIPRAELMEALRTNFENNERIRQMLLHKAEKYGNDGYEVDALARRVAEQFIALMDGMESPLHGRYFVHLFSFRCNIEFGKTVGATPDGRLARAPLAYSLSAQQGMDMNGVTAMLTSLSRLPHNKAAGASAAIVEIDPVLVEGEAGVQTLCQLIRTAMTIGVGQLQWNVTTAEQLRKAQEDPEKYGNIAVRVAGYSQRFKLIDTELQNHIIARTKHRQ